VRIGVNAGELTEEAGDLHGSAVNLASRVCSAAGAGEILCTAAVRDLAAGQGFEFDDRGDAQLKGFARPQHLYALAPR
jgi:class 3 adenylate cyclase